MQGWGEVKPWSVSPGLQALFAVSCSCTVWCTASSTPTPSPSPGVTLPLCAWLLQRLDEEARIVVVEHVAAQRSRPGPTERQKQALARALRNCTLRVLASTLDMWRAAIRR